MLPLQDKALDLTLSIFITTRPRRSSEVNGIHYHFINRATFMTRMKTGRRIAGSGGGARQRLRHAAQTVQGNPRVKGRDMLFDIDWQGAEQVRRALGDDVVSNLRSCRLRCSGAAACCLGAPRRKIPRRRSTRASPTRGARSSAGDSTTTSSSTTICKAHTA